MTREDDIMLGMGFRPSDNGPFVSRLRKRIAKKVANGLRYHSAGTWASECELTPEERARALLEADWAVERGHSCRVEALDGLDPANPAPWIRDRAREAAMNLRILRDKMMGITNPYK